MSHLFVMHKLNNFAHSKYYFIFLIFSEKQNDSKHNEIIRKHCLPKIMKEVHCGIELLNKHQPGIINSVTFFPKVLVKSGDIASTITKQEIPLHSLTYEKDENGESECFDLGFMAAMANIDAYTGDFHTE